MSETAQQFEPNFPALLSWEWGDKQLTDEWYLHLFSVMGLELKTRTEIQGLTSYYVESGPKRFRLPLSYDQLHELAKRYLRERGCKLFSIECDETCGNSRGGVDIPGQCRVTIHVYDDPFPRFFSSRETADYPLMRADCLAIALGRAAKHFYDLKKQAQKAAA